MLPPRVLLLPALLAVVFLSGLVTAGRCKCRKKVDVFFLLDMSASIGDKEFKKILRFTEAIVKRLCVSPRHANVAVASFSVGFKREINLSSNKKKILESIKKIVYEDGSRTNLGPALKEIRKMIVQQGRKRVPSVVVALTDGFPYDIHSMKVEGRNNHVHGILTFALGFGKSSKYLLSFIASKPLYRFRKKIKSADDLDKLSLQIQVVRRICPKKGPGYCLVTGDPHIKQPDGMSYIDNGLCTYTLVKTCPEDIAPSFEIQMSNRMCGRGTLKVPVTCAKSITTYVYETEIRMLRKGKVFVNGRRVVLPHTINFQAGQFIELALIARKPTLYTDFGLRVQYKRSNAYISIPRNYAKKVCGLCGNFNGRKWDDAILKNGTQLVIPKPRRKRNRNRVFKHVVNSWLVPEIGHTHKHCVAPDVVPLNCSSMAHHEARGHCAPLKDRNGVFGECVRGIGKSMTDDLFDDCVYDVCEGTDRCAELDSFANVCRLQGYKITRIRWRKELYCKLRCGPNARYRRKMTGCPPTCADPDAPSSCPVENQEGCQCKRKYIWEGDECIYKDQCGCVDSDDSYHKLGESWLTPTCTFQKFCDNSGKIGEVQYQCPSNYTCVSENGAGTCKL